MATSNQTPAGRAAKSTTVTAAGPVRHGVTNDGVTTFTDYAEGDTFEADAQHAEALAAAGHVVTASGSQAVADQAAQQKQPADAEAIDRANAKADKERAKTAAKEAGDLA